MGQFATNMQRRIEAKQRGETPTRSRTSSASAASGSASGPLQLALMRVFRRFFLPYQRPEEAL